MAQGQQQQGGGGDNAYAPIWIMVILIVIGGGLWYFAHAYIVAMVYNVKLFEAYAVNMITGALGVTIQLIQTSLQAPSEVTFEQLSLVSFNVGNYVRYPVIVILLLLAFWLYNSDITSKFRNTYSMKSLLEKEYPNWPQISPIVKLNLIDKDVTKGPWAMAQNPLEFLMHNKLVKHIKVQEGTGRRVKEVTALGVLKGEAKRIFTLQLGTYWEGAERLSMPNRALFAIFAAKFNRDRKAANELLLQINKSTITGKLDFSGVDALLKKHIDTSSVQKVISRHAYVLTVMASLLEGSRTDGVFPTADFLWLKPIDRRLWYMLNVIGRQTPFCEVAGPFAHWLAEKELGRKSLVPMVDEAVKALDSAIADIKYVPKDDEQEST